MKLYWIQERITVTEENVWEILKAIKESRLYWRDIRPTGLANMIWRAQCKMKIQHPGSKHIKNFKMATGEH